ncbi:MAG: NADH-quinone oxidoreductase subunit NuoE [bacterium]
MCLTMDIDWVKIDEIIKKYENKEGSVIPVLEETQGIVGYLPKEVLGRVADGLNISRSIVYGIVTFYSFFSIKPRGRNVARVCLGTACYVKGADAILNRIKEVLKIDTGEITEDRKFSLEAVRCVGACGLAPVMMINEDVHGHLEQGKIEKILETYQ